MPLYSNFTQLGEIQILQLYEYYDRPLLFSCYNTKGELFLAVLTDETQTDEAWLYADISEERLNEVKKSNNWHDAFAKAEGHAYRVVIPHDQNIPATLAYVKPCDIPEDDLPFY